LVQCENTPESDSQFVDTERRSFPTILNHGFGHLQLVTEVDWWSKRHTRSTTSPTTPISSQ
jgi:hypothetical protein